MTVSEIKPTSKHVSDFEKIKNLVEQKQIKDHRIAIYTHPGPDPDAIASMIGMQYLFEVYFNIECDCYYSGEISHPQNKAMVQLMDVHLARVDYTDDPPDGHSIKILVDTIPINAGAWHETRFDLVIDHHKELPNGGYNGAVIHHHTGSCAGIVYDIIKSSGIPLSDEDEKWCKIANGLLIGIINDTDHCMSMDTTRRDFAARQELFAFQDHDLIRQIIKFNRPMSWVKLRGMAINEVVIDEGIAVVGLGILPDEQRDVIADIANDMLTWGNVQTAVVFAMFGDRIEGSLRTNSPTVEIHTLCAQLGGKCGSGGGKLCKGSYKKQMGSMAFDDDDDETIKSELWDVAKRREIQKILKVMKI